MSNIINNFLAIDSFEAFTTIQDGGDVSDGHFVIHNESLSGHIEQWWLFSGNDGCSYCVEIKFREDGHYFYVSRALQFNSQEEAVDFLRE